MRRPSRQGQLAVCLYSFIALHTAIISNALLLFLRRGYLVALLMLVGYPVYPQNLREAVDTYFQTVRGGGRAAPEAFTATLARETPAVFFEAIEPWLHDSSITVRRKACELIQLSASGSDDPHMRSQAVDLLVKMSGGEPLELTHARLGLLTHFKRGDFSRAARDTLRRLVRSAARPADRIIRLAAFAGLRDVAGHIRPYSQPGNPQQLRWAALTALARLGESDAVADVMRTVRKFPVDDDVVYTLFPDLVYTRQPDAIAYLVEALQSDAKNCHSADAENAVAIACGYRIMEQLAPVIEGFPIALQENGDLATSDYPAALDAVRAWFSANTTYTIRDDTY